MQKRLRATLAAATCLAVLAGGPASALPTPPAMPPAVTDNGAYVVLGKNPGTGPIEFKFGWNTINQFYAPPSGYWIGIYDVTRSHYVWADETQFRQLPVGTQVTEKLELQYKDPVGGLAPGEYCINFFVRENPSANVAVVQLFFTVK